MDEQDRLKAFPSVTVGSTCITHQAEFTPIIVKNDFRHQILWYIRLCTLLNICAITKTDNHLLVQTGETVGCEGGRRTTS